MAAAAVLLSVTAASPRDELNSLTAVSFSLSATQPYHKQLMSVVQVEPLEYRDASVINSINVEIDAELKRV
jgi:hypothetical protein